MSSAPNTDSATALACPRRVWRGVAVATSHMVTVPSAFDDATVAPSGSNARWLGRPVKVPRRGPAVPGARYRAPESRSRCRCSPGGRPGSAPTAARPIRSESVRVCRRSARSHQVSSPCPEMTTERPSGVKAMSGAPHELVALHGSGLPRFDHRADELEGPQRHGWSPPEPRPNRRRPTSSDPSGVKAMSPRSPKAKFGSEQHTSRVERVDQSEVGSAVDDVPRSVARGSARPGCRPGFRCQSRRDQRLPDLLVGPRRRRTGSCCRSPEPRGSNRPG